ncbi:MAG TPA: YciI family protein [Acidobacteriaceae bacterium]|nr:YciI family protein [Acidobacteriaceae bacterium]
MRYMMLIYSGEDDAAAPDDMRAVAEAHRSFMEEARRLGILVAGDPLQTSATATVVRVEQSKTLVTDGPYAETKEQLAGYYILDCRDLDEALAWAAKIPTGCAGAAGCVEVRPLREIPRNG